MITLASVSCITDNGRPINAYLVIGKQDEDTTELHVVGTVGNVGPFYGTTTIREGRDEPDANYTWGNGEQMERTTQLEIEYAMMAKLDEQVDGLLEQEMNRICG